MTGVQTCALPICFPVTIIDEESYLVNKDEGVDIFSEDEQQSTLMTNAIEFLKNVDTQQMLTNSVTKLVEQRSMQLQGEVQELAIEKWLKEKYPFDTIDEVKKGARGADCMQIVHTRESQNCGKIYYESKRTKDFQKSWIEKLNIIGINNV